MFNPRCNQKCDILRRHKKRCPNSKPHREKLRMTGFARYLSPNRAWGMVSSPPFSGFRFLRERLQFRRGPVAPALNTRLQRSFQPCENLPAVSFSPGDGPVGGITADSVQFSLHCRGRVAALCKPKSGVLKAGRARGQAVLRTPSKVEYAQRRGPPEDRRAVAVGPRNDKGVIEAAANGTRSPQVQRSAWPSLTPTGSTRANGNATRTG